MLVKCTYILLAFALIKVGASLTCYKCSSRFNGEGCGKVVNETIHTPIQCTRGEICMLEINYYYEKKEYSRDCQSQCTAFSSNMLSRKCCSEDRCNAEPLKCYGCSSKLDEGCGHVVDPKMQDPNSCDDMDACLLEENKESAEHIYFRYCAKACEPIKSANRTKRCCMDDLCNSGKDMGAEIIYIEKTVVEKSKSTLTFGLVIGALALLVIIILVVMSYAINNLRKKAAENTREDNASDMQTLSHFNNNAVSSEPYYEDPRHVSASKTQSLNIPQGSADRPPLPQRAISEQYNQPVQFEDPYPPTMTALAQT